MSGSRRRSSLLDEMAMVAESQRLIEMELGGGSSDDDEDDDDDDELDDVEEEDDYDLEKEDDDDDDDEAELEDQKGGDMDDVDGEDEEEVDYEYGPTFVSENDEDVASLSHVGSEELDRFDLDQTVPAGFSWNPRASRILEESAVSEFNLLPNLNTTSDGRGPGTSSDDSADINNLDYGRISPFNQSSMRRPSHAESEGSFNSAPARADADHPQTFELRASQQRRPLSISVPNAEGEALSRRTSQRRTSVNIKTALSHTAAAARMSVSNSSSVSNDDEATETSSNSGILGSIRNRRRSTRRQNLSVGGYGSLDHAIASLRTQDSNSEWENVAAAAAVVAAGNQGAVAKSRHIQFAVNDTALVFLTLLNVTNMEDPKDTFTVAPVNKFGFPAGEGFTEQEKSGPYSFVLATVVHVHFDEDDRYYTIVRADTGTEQRADSGWMEPIKDPVGIEAAARAASRTVRSTQDKPIEESFETGYLQDLLEFFTDTVSWPKHFVRTKLYPWYQLQRDSLKRTMTMILFGQSPFACRIQITGVNLLVLCSIVYLFLEVINLAFLPASADQTVAIVGTVVWSILALELIFEVLIRPKDYTDLVNSEKAFAPSAARHINRFHLFFETLALITFFPEFSCVADAHFCQRSTSLSKVQASLDAVLGESHAMSAQGRFILGLTALRFFGVVRHWKQMWIMNTFKPKSKDGIKNWLLYQDSGDDASSQGMGPGPNHPKKIENESIDNTSVSEKKDRLHEKASSEEDQRLKKAATIGTALMVVNSHRALVLLTCTIFVLPLMDSLNEQNQGAYGLANLLHSNNLEAGMDCDYLQNSIESWLGMAVQEQPNSLLSNSQDTYVLWAQIHPAGERCNFLSAEGIITNCTARDHLIDSHPSTCEVWDDPDVTTSSGTVDPYYFSSTWDLRLGGIREIILRDPQNPNYNTTVIFNENPSVALTNMGLFFMLLGILVLGLFGLQALRSDAIKLVLDPLQRMLKIVLRYAENPLSQEVKGDAKGLKGNDQIFDKEAEEIGNYETEQLINAITNIANLLRKCWGVAGADIITSNLKRTKDGKTVVFNPTVPGKRVYALFGFVAINGFSDQLRALDRDVMILINDVASVVHDEVFRWALGNSGQCNKNLGAAFLMVFRIGDFSEVHDKKKRATNVVFSNNAKASTQKTSLRRRNRGGRLKAPLRRGRRKNDDGEGALQLASLPGIQAFTDRALLGMLKSYAGLHRDKSMNAWKNDFRLSAGVHAYNVDIIYGMDAGWAVEGAVGSEYKIDATYLSPHVNMASRMMSATKQYGVTILLSKAVEELLSRPCRKKLRHLDTVYVKGSKVKQDIFTYDARHRGVDFFLLERTPEQADVEAESYSASIWDNDQDLKAMRQHVTDEFMEAFALGVKQYLGGRWQDAHKNFLKADDIMIQTMLDDGYIDFDEEELRGKIFDGSCKDEEVVRVRNELGDGACRVLMSYMERRNLSPPPDWDAVRQLSSK